jgi:hypothetical protein
MSIINDALKKAGQPVIAETNRSGSEHGDAAGKSSGAPHADIRPEILVDRRRPRSSAGWKPLLALAVIALIAAPMVAPWFRPSANSGADIQTVSLGPEVSSGAPQQFAIEEAPVPGPSLPPAAKKAGLFQGGKFVLSGVVYSGEESYCLLNGKVVKTGERVGDAVVEKITPDEVLLNVNGQQVIVPVTG